MNKKCYIFLFIFSVLYNTSSQDNEIVISKKVWEGDFALSMNSKWNSNLDTDKYGLSLKDFPYPFILGDKIIFNTEKGVCLYNLITKKIMAFYDNYMYYSYDLIRKRMILANKENIKMVSIDNGNTVWEVKNIASSFDRIYINLEKVIIRTTENKIICMNINDGKYLWKKGYQDYYYVSNISISDRSEYTSFDVVSEYIFYNDKLLFGSYNGFICSISLIDGKMIWEQKIDKPAYSSIVLYNDKIYIASTQGYIYSLSLEDGRIVNTYKVKQNEFNCEMEEIGNMIIKNGFIYGISQGLIFVIDIEHNKGFYISSDKLQYFIPNVLFITKNYFWLLPESSYLTGTAFTGFNTYDINKPAVKFLPEGPGYSMEHIVDKKLDTIDFSRFKKNQFVEWNDYLVLVEPDKIIGYAIVQKKN